MRCAIVPLLLTCLLVAVGCGKSDPDPLVSLDKEPSEKSVVTISGTRWGERNPDGTGTLYVQTTDGVEKEVDSTAINHWHSDDKLTLYYSYFGEGSVGEGLKRYNIVTGNTDLVFDHGLIVLFVQEAKAKSGRIALIVSMINAESERPQSVVADPDRGKVFSVDLAKFSSVEDGALTLGVFTEQQLKGSSFGQWPEPEKTQTHDLDELLAREATR